MLDKDCRRRWACQFRGTPVSSEFLVNLKHLIWSGATFSSPGVQGENLVFSYLRAYINDVTALFSKYEHFTLNYRSLLANKRAGNIHPFNFSWFSIFIQLAGLEPVADLTELTLARLNYPRPSAEELIREMEISTSFIVARNPFERLGVNFTNVLRAAFSYKSL